MLASQRGRLLDAMAQAVAEHGYGATTIAHVVSRAGVSRKTFYDHFSDKKECFLAMYDTGIGFLLGRVAETLEGQDDPHCAAWSWGCRPSSTVLSAEPAFCRAIIVEVHAAGPEALARRRAVLQVFADRYLEINRQAREGRKSIEPLSEDVALGRGGRRSSSSCPLAWRPGAPPSCPSWPSHSPRFVVHNVLARA